MLPTHAPAPNGGALEHATGMLTQEQLDLIKRTIAYGATDDELTLFVHTARRLGLDPLARQIHFVKRRRRTPDGRWEEYGVIQVGIDGLRAVAERSGKYAGQLGPYWCDEYGEWRDVWLSPQPPAAAKVGVLRSDFREPIWGVARYATYVQTDASGQPTSLWRKMPDLMLAKCAEALALRRAFPQDLSGVYAPEEMMQADSHTSSTHDDVDLVLPDPPPPDTSSRTQIAPPPAASKRSAPAPQRAKTLREMLDCGGDDAAAAKRAMAALHARMSDAGIDVTDRDRVHRIASEALQRDVQSLRDLTIDEARTVWLWVDRLSQSAPPVAPPSPPPPPKTGWSAWIEKHRNHIVLGSVIDALERRHIDPDDLCAYVYGAPAPATDEQSQAIIEDLAARWAQYAASYQSHSQEA